METGATGNRRVDARYTAGCERGCNGILRRGNVQGAGSTDTVHIDDQRNL